MSDFTRMFNSEPSTELIAPKDEISLWRGISLNPNLILGISTGTDAHAKLAKDTLRSERRVVLSQNLSLNFKKPLQINRGEGAYLFDEQNRPYLDLVNNVAHVGHGNPRVVEAASRQMSALNTNTRYLHQAIIEYGKAITSTLPDPLSVILFVNSGSEANDLAIRLARAHTQAKGVISLRHGYHGHTQSVMEISPYKFLGKGGQGKPDHLGVLLENRLFVLPGDAVQQIWEDPPPGGVGGRRAKGRT